MLFWVFSSAELMRCVCRGQIKKQTNKRTHLRRKRRSLHGVVMGVFYRAPEGTACAASESGGNGGGGVEVNPQPFRVGALPEERRRSDPGPRLSRRSEGQGGRRRVMDSCSLEETGRGRHPFHSRDPRSREGQQDGDLVQRSSVTCSFVLQANTYPLLCPLKNFE